MPQRDPVDVAYELQARGYVDTIAEGRRMVIEEPEVVRALLRYHDKPELRHVDDITHPGW